jgi:hypothetical protein
MSDLNGKDGNGWIAWRHHILLELTRYNTELIALRSDLHVERALTAKEIASLKAKSGIAGAIGGLLPAMGIFIYFIVKS